MVANRNRWLRKLWRRGGKLVGRSGSSGQQLPVAVGSVPAYFDQESGHWKGDLRRTANVLRLLLGDIEREIGGPRFRSPQSTGSMESTRARAVPSESNAGYLVTDREIHYGTVRRRSESAAGYVTASFGPYDAEDFAPRGGLQ